MRHIRVIPVEALVARLMARAVFSVVLVVTPVLIADRAAALVFEGGLFVFGDSLSDNGNACPLASSCTSHPVPPYASGRFSNGLLWIDVLRLSLFAGIAEGEGGGNYAVAGATSLDVLDQVDGYLQVYPVSPDALYVVWAGANDGLAGGDPSIAAGNVALAIETLVDNGARWLLVPNLPDLASTPQEAGDPAAHQFTVDFNAALAAYLDALPGDVAIFELDAFALAGELVSAPATFGLTNVTDACWNGVSVCANPSDHLYWDQLHPTTVAHEIIGSAARAMVPGPQNVFAADAAAGDRFGQAVSASMDWLAVGAPRADVDGDANQGAVYLQRRIGSMAFPFEKLSEGSPNDRFGLSVSISGDWLAVGAPLDDVVGVDQGSVHLYAWNGTSWSLQQTLTDPGGAAGDMFGYAVSIAGDTLVVTAPLDDVGIAVDRGSALVYQRDGNSWSPTQQLLGPTGAAGDQFGVSVSSASGRIAVGSPGDDIGSNADQGSAYVFGWTGTSWALEEKLTDSGGAANDVFGGAISIMGDLVAVGAYLDDNVGNDRGSVHIYEFESPDWLFQQKLDLPPGEGDASQFGASVVFISPYDLAVGASRALEAGAYPQGAAFFYERDAAPGAIWTFSQKLTAPVGPFLNDEFGSVLASSGRGVIVGAYADDNPSAVDQGSVYLFEPKCGDEVVTFTERCDDGNDSPGDGCSALCTTEPGFFCGPVAPSICAPIAECWNGMDDDGDGLSDFGEDPDCTSITDTSELNSIACIDGVDNDGDSFIDFGSDPGCASDSDTSEQSPTLPCDDGTDNDGDGVVDYSDDPGCFLPGSLREDPKCQDGLDNDGDGSIDFDGGASANGGVPLGPVDPQCPAPFKDKETAGGCGAGAELLPILVGLGWIRGRRFAGRTARLLSRS